MKENVSGCFFLNTVYIQFNKLTLAGAKHPAFSTNHFAVTNKIKL